MRSVDRSPWGVPLALVLLVSGGGGCGRGGPLAPGKPLPELFVDRTAESGIDFSHLNGMSGEFYLPEIIGPGGAFLDYDNDGDLDVFMVQGAPLGVGGSTEDGPRDRLYRNEFHETGRLRFVAVDEAGVDGRGYGMGAATGDFDSDGWIDLYVTNFGPNVLLRNNGDGTFSDVTEVSGTGDSGWSTSSAFVDYDGDGHLDLFVANYLEFTIAGNIPCYSATGTRDYCDPQAYAPSPDRLYRNRGDGTFEDVTAVSQIARAYGAGLGVICTDLNGDGRVDIYVANDGYPNQLWINRGSEGFRDESLLGGCSLNAEGKAEASMGLDAADFDGDGDEDLFMTHIDEETNTLYVNEGGGNFTDATLQTGVGNSSRRHTGFGTAFVDYDNDGWLDLIVVNGAVKTLDALARSGDPYPLHQKNQIFRNLGNGRFEDVSTGAGPAFELSEVSRGAAFGDVDEDGDIDFMIFNNNGPARLLLNQVGSSHHWLGLRMVHGPGAIDAIGTRLRLELDDGSVLWRRVRAAASYCSANDPRVSFGLGDSKSVGSMRAYWTDGKVEEWDDLPIDRYTTLEKGSGRDVSPGS